MPSEQPDPKHPGRLTAILSKQPQAGQVKTRLCPPLEPAQAAGLAAAMLQDTIERCQAAAEAGSYRAALWYAPASAKVWFRRAAPGLALFPQAGAGLAERMAQALDLGLSQSGTESMVLIGSDQPMVPGARILEAHRALEAGCDVVLGPDAGGGYYLIGMKRPHPELFHSIPMSTGTMRQQTVELARELGLRVQLLEEGYDVDVAADLLRLAADLWRWNEPAHPDFPRHSQALIARLPSTPALPFDHG